MEEKGEKGGEEEGRREVESDKEREERRKKKKMASLELDHGPPCGTFTANLSS